MIKSWIRTETRAVRPFVTLSEVLAGTSFRLARSKEFEEVDFFDVEDTDQSDMAPGLSLAINKKSIDAAWPRGSQSLNIVVRLVDLQLRRTSVVLDSPLSSAPDFLEIPDTDVKRFAWSSGVKVTVALVLRENREPQPGKPFLKGHWVARKDFRVGLKTPQHAFPIVRWDAEDFQKAQLPGDTAFWVELNTEDFNRKFDAAEDAFRICIRSDVLDVLVDTQSSPASRAITSVLLAEIVTDLFFAGLKNLGEDEEIVPDGVLAGILRRLNKSTGVSRDRLVALSRSGDRASIRAFVQAMLSTKRLIVAAKGSI